MLTRRSILTMMAAGAIAPAAEAHTLYNQWVVYRQKHLLIGSHRKDPATYALALEVTETLDHLLPEASARAARAPHPERLASLLGTRQLELAVLSRDHAAQMQTAQASFAAYGEVPLLLVSDLHTHILVGHAAFPARHAWLVAAALREAGFEAGAPALSDGMLRHPGSEAHLTGVAFSEL